MTKKKHLVYLAGGFYLYRALVGAGFASGQELLKFLLCSGRKG